MNILMFTNTYFPHVGGVARSVQSFVRRFRDQGHRVLVVAPEFPDMPSEETDVLRVPAIQNFNGSDFSVRLPIPSNMFAPLDDFEPDIVHSHHPFLLGDTALRIAALKNVPLVFTHHTLYEQYTHYVPGKSTALAQAVIKLSTAYANMCHQVIAPSESIRDILRRRGVMTPIEVVPTGINTEFFAAGDGQRARQRFGIPEDAYVVGHVGRLAPEKNLAFMSESIVQFLQTHPSAQALIVGEGPTAAQIESIFHRAGMRERLYLTGTLGGSELTDAYHAMDVFAFSSKSETQGLVLAEAMAAGLPVVALDASGAREVVEDFKNGRLLPGQRRQDFVDALRWCANLTPEAREEYRAHALETARRFSDEVCAAGALTIYTQLADAGREFGAFDDATWTTAQRLIEIEWNLLGARAKALRRLFDLGMFVTGPTLRRLTRSWRAMKRFFSRGEWAIRLLQLPSVEGQAAEPGLVLIQIDGFSKAQLERALHNGRMPFLRRLLSREGYTLRSFYSGVPSTTPAVQGELYYGVKTAVPAFQYFDREKGERRIMFDPEAAGEVEGKLQTIAQGLLNGGSCYSNIFTGGAREWSFCPSAMGWGAVLKAANPLSLIALGFAYWTTVVKLIGLAAFELILAVLDAVNGIAKGMRIGPELRFIPTRIAVSILIREMITMGAIVDVRRGLPVIHLNFLGYDEQAHRRGPGSQFAHWALKGIDAAIYRIWQAAIRSPRRSYEVWVFADHGQEQSVPYRTITGKTIGQAMRELFETPVFAGPGVGRFPETQNRRTWFSRVIQIVHGIEADTSKGSHDELIVTALGPLGHVYVPTDVEYDRAEVARRMVEEFAIPLALYREGEEVRARTKRGTFRLAHDAEEVLGADHPYGKEAAEDLVRLATHANAGDFVICGWDRDAPTITFAFEHGSHGGPGSEETETFLIAPRLPRFLDTEGLVLRPQVLRQAALEFLEGAVPQPARKRLTHWRRTPEALRIMTYNVHSCVGLDGKLSPFRIAKVIAGCEPDIVALQELDVGRARTERLDQAHAIAHELQMDVAFHPAMLVEEEQYGDAILSRYPLRLLRTGMLPIHPQNPAAEPRGAILVEVEVQGCKVLLLNTHLGLSRAERERQTEALLGPEWLGSYLPDQPVILCGDFNFGPKSGCYRRLREHFRDVQTELSGHRPRNTWYARIPLNRIDHVFVTPQLTVSNVLVPRSALTKVASDHLPLVVDLLLPAVAQQRPADGSRLAMG